MQYYLQVDAKSEILAITIGLSQVSSAVIILDLYSWIINAMFWVEKAFRITCCN